MSEASQDPAKKIIVDEDWKSQVEAEREALRSGEEKGEPAGQPASRPLPPPTLGFLFTDLYLRAAVALKLLPNPLTDKPQLDLPLAKHSIDLLQMLQEKTEGHRTPEETEELEAVLHQLRLAYVAAQRA